MNQLIMYDVAMSMVGKPYIWGGDDPVEGFDCSGLVIELLKTAGLFPEKADMNSQGLYDFFSKTASHNILMMGSLCFYGKDIKSITHVAFMISDNCIIEAGGGGSKTKSAKDAAAQNAYIRVRQYNRRKDLVAVLRPLYSWDEAQPEPRGH